MKLLTHNMLACHIKGVRNTYPFKIEAAKVEDQEADYDPGECLGGGDDRRGLHTDLDDGLRPAGVASASQTFCATYSHVSAGTHFSREHRA